MAGREERADLRAQVWELLEVLKMETKLIQYVKALIHVVAGVPAAEGEGPAGDKPSRVGGAGESSQGEDST